VPYLTAILKVTDSLRIKRLDRELRVFIDYCLRVCEFLTKQGCFCFNDMIYRVIPSVLDPRKYEYLKDYSLDFE
jgi:hypothetical protein